MQKQYKTISNNILTMHKHYKTIYNQIQQTLENNMKQYKTTYNRIQLYKKQYKPNRTI